MWKTNKYSKLLWDQGQRQGSTTILNWLYTTVSIHLMIVNVREWSRPILKMRILADPCTKLKSTKAQQVFEFWFWASKMTKFEYSDYSTPILQTIYSSKI